jgi:NTE family protein
MNRQKDLQYSSRSMAQIKRQRQLHRMRHIIAELSAMLPPEKAKDQAVAEMRSYGCTTTMHVVRLLAPALEYEDHSKDIDFSPEGIRQRWEAGYRHTMETIEMAPWRGKFDPLEGFILHEACGGEMVQTAAGRA